MDQQDISSIASWSGFQASQPGSCFLLFVVEEKGPPKPKPVKLIDVRRISNDGTPAFSVYNTKTFPQVYDLDGRLLAEYPEGDLVATTYLTDQAVSYVFDNPSGEEVEIVFSAVEGTVGIFQQQFPQPSTALSIGPFSPAAVAWFQAAVARNGQIHVRRSGKRFDISLPMAPDAPIAPTTVIHIAQAVMDGPSPVALAKTEHKKVTLVAIGDSVTAGFQSSTLMETFQPNGYVPLLARQMARAVPMDPPEFPLPLITRDGLPLPEFDLNANSFPPFSSTGPDPRTKGRRKNPSVQAHNLAVPEFTIRQILDTTLLAENLDNRFTLAGPLSREILIGPILDKAQRDQKVQNKFQVDAPQVFQAAALKPSLLIVWAGNNDTIGAIFFPSRVEGRLTAVPAFEQRLKAILQKVRAPGRGIVLVDLPDLTRTPFLRPLGEPVTPLPFTVDETRYPLSVRLEIEMLEAVTSETLDQILATLVLPRGIARDRRNREATGKFFATGSSVPLTILGHSLENLIKLAVSSLSKDISTKSFFTEDEVLEAGLPDEFALIRSRIEGYNSLIAEQLGDDIFLFPVAREFRAFTSQERALRGGLFSLDGIHPNDAGHRRVARRLIEELNRHLGSRDFGGLRRGSQIPDVGP